MEQLNPDEPFKINLLSLNCRLTVSGHSADQIFFKYNDKRLYPTKGSKFIEVAKGGSHKFEDLTLTFPGRIALDTIVIEMWYRKNFFQNALAGRFFFMLNISEVGFSATQLIRSSVQEVSHYLLHWEMRPVKESVVSNREFKLKKD